MCCSHTRMHARAHTHTHCSSGFCLRLPGWAGTRKVKTRKVKAVWIYWSKSECQWHLLGHMQICTSPHTDNRANIPTLSFLQVGCPSWHSCHPTSSIKALKATNWDMLDLCVQRVVDMWICVNSPLYQCLLALCPVLVITTISPSPSLLLWNCSYMLSATRLHFNNSNVSCTG